MKFSRAIRAAIDGRKWKMPNRDKMACPICVTVARRTDGFVLCRDDACGRRGSMCEGLCPACNEVADSIFNPMNNPCGFFNCRDWGRRARDLPNSDERIAAEELILCLEAQGD